MKQIILTRDEWAIIQQEMVKDYGDTILLSWVCKRKLGFTRRLHRARGIAGLVPEEYIAKYATNEQIHLDFYDESLKTFFLLKYYNDVEEIARRQADGKA